MNEYDKRRYQRGKHFDCSARMSLDDATWQTVLIHDLSSGGLSFCTAEAIDVGITIDIELQIGGFFSDFEIKTRATVRRAGPFGQKTLYGVEFLDLDPRVKVRIDENVRGRHLSEGLAREPK